MPYYVSKSTTSKKCSTSANALAMMMMMMMISLLYSSFPIWYKDITKAQKANAALQHNLKHNKDYSEATFRGATKTKN
jgi:archaellum component FlaF (FlaF/FlaG flagellin family)